MKIKLHGKNLNEIRPLLGDFGLEEDDRDYEVIVTYGGDGALLGAEELYPGVPKFPLRDEVTAPTCGEHSLRNRLASFIGGKEILTLLPKVSCRTASGEIRGINDIFLHSASPVSALRFRVKIDGEVYADDVIGDGVGVATVHGSGAYYRNIARGQFRVGFGLAFNNADEPVNHLVLDTASSVEVTLKRGPALAIADNSKSFLTVNERETVVFRQLDTGHAKIYGLSGFMCGSCRKLRHHRQ